MARFQTDSIFRTAARALAAGNPLGALNFIALRNDAPALALRGIAMAQLDDFARAKILLRKAARAFGSKAAVARARCILAEAEIALASRELGRSARSLEEARTTLEAHGDHANAAHATLLHVRRLLLIGRVEQADRALAELNPAPLPPALRTARELITAAIAIRRIRTGTAQAALVRAERAARLTGIPALIAEVESVARTLNAPAARLIRSGTERLLSLNEVESLLASNILIVDACRRTVRNGASTISLARRPILFVLVRALAEAWPGDAARSTLVAQAFQAKRINESHRARLRVEIGRLRKSIKALAGISATARGFVLAPRRTGDIAVLAWPSEEEHAAVLGFLADGESWSSSALATALGFSQRTVQRALDSLAAAGKVQAFGRGRARRWMTPTMPGFTTVLLLPPSLPLD
jgi:hypothetical protein